jgi:hypothetical protein
MNGHTGRQRMTQPLHASPFDEHPHVAAYVVLFVDHAKPQARKLAIEIVKDLTQGLPLSLHPGLLSGVAEER